MLESRDLKTHPYFMSTKSIVVVTGLGGQTLAKLIHKVLALPELIWPGETLLVALM